MAELSREAMALMGLSPMWKRRERYQDAAAVASYAGSGLQIAVVVSDAASGVLWKRISSVLIGLGFSRVVLEQSIVVQGPQADVLTHRLREQRPAALLVLGNDLLQAARSADPALFDGLRVSVAPSLAECIASLQAKRQLWANLTALHRQFSDGICPPQ